MHQPPTPPGPPGADSGALSGPPDRQNAEAGAHTGTGPLADVPRRWWRARLACGHDVEVAEMSGTVPPQLHSAVECPRCGVRQTVDIYPLTALSDPDNLGWVRVDPDEPDDDAFTQWHECEIELWDGEYDR